MKSKKIISLFIAAVMAVSVFALTPASASAKAKITYKKASKVYKQDKTPIVKLSLKLPKISGSSKVVKNINSYFSKVKKKYVKAAKKVLTAAKNQLNESPDTFNCYQFTYAAKASYNKDGKLSFKVKTFVYTGGAHGLGTVSGVTFDKKTGKKLAVSKLTKYAPADLKKMIVAATNKKIDKDPDNFFEGAKETVKNTKLNKFNCFLKDNYLYVVYQVYDIAPYAYGPIAVKIKL